MSSGVLLTPSAAKRTAEAVRYYESIRGGGRVPAGAPRAAEPIHIRVTSSTADGNGNYPGVITARQSDGSWQDYSAVKVRPLNGEPLTSGTRYGCRGVGFAPGGEELYVPLSGGGVAADVELVRATSTGASTSSGYVQSYSGGGYADSGGAVSLAMPNGRHFESTATVHLAVKVGGVYHVVDHYATRTEDGLVSVNAQGFSGHKTFANGLTSVDEIFVDEEEGAGEEGRGRLWLKLYRTMPGGGYGTATASEAVIGLWQTGMDPINTYPPDLPCIRFISPVLGDTGNLTKMFVQAKQQLHIVAQAIRVNEDGNGWTGTGSDGEYYALGIRLTAGTGGSGFTGTVP